MSTSVSLDIHVSILKRVDPFGSETHRARIIIGKRQFEPEPDTEEVFWCCASGRNFFDCVRSVREQALSWAELKRIANVTGLTDSETISAKLQTGEIAIVIEPVTYNDWLLEPHVL